MTLGGTLMKTALFIDLTKYIYSMSFWETELNTPYYRCSRKVWFILFLKELGLVSNDSLAYARQIHWEQSI